MKQIYLTHCSHKKNERYQETGEPALPQELYTATPIQRFMEKCRREGVEWAIFSDQYGVWFPKFRRKWYEKDPDTVTGAEFELLLRNFDDELRDFSKILFYHNPGRFHPLYRRLFKESCLGDRIQTITHLWDIR